MRKENKKIQVIRMMSEGEVKNLGSSRWFNKVYKFLTIYLLAWVVYSVAIGQFLHDGNLVLLLVAIPALVGFAIIYYFAGRAGDKFWREVKDKEQPVDVN